MDHTPRNKVHTTKFLGVTIDDKLTISRNVCVLLKLRSFLPPATIVSLYNNLISPYLTYCNIIWARASTTKLNSLSIIQKRAIRICTFSPPRAQTAPLFAQLIILALLQGLSCTVCEWSTSSHILVYVLTSVHDIHTRSYENHFLPFTRTSYSIHTLRHYHGPRLWNSIDLSIVRCCLFYVKTHPYKL